MAEPTVATATDKQRALINKLINETKKSLQNEEERERLEMVQDSINYLADRGILMRDDASKTIELLKELKYTFSPDKRKDIFKEIEEILRGYE